MADHVDAIEVSGEIGGSAGLELPANVRLVISDGVSIPVEPGSVDVAFSHQLMEHLHPDDAREQLTNVHRALRAGGRYVCLTPNRHTGPHDVSAYFDDEPTGLHLREYTMSELGSLFRDVGFTRRRVLVGGKGRYAAVPTWLVPPFEGLLGALPRRFARPLRRSSPLRLLMGVGIVAAK